MSESAMLANDAVAVSGAGADTWAGAAGFGSCTHICRVV